MSEPASAGEVLVQVVPVESGREIGWGSSRVEVFRADLRMCERRWCRASGVADSLDGVPRRRGGGW